MKLLTTALLILAALSFNSCGGRPVKFKPAYDEFEAREVTVTRIEEFNPEEAKLVLEGVTCNEAYDFIDREFGDTDIECTYLKKGVILVAVPLDRFRELIASFNEGKGNSVD